MPYTDKQVVRGLKLAGTQDKCSWELGELALEVAPVVIAGDDWKTDPAKGELERFADAIGVRPTHLLKLRRMAAAFPRDARRADLGWSIHAEFVSLKDPVKSLGKRKWTRRTAREFVQEQSGKTNVKVQTPELTARQKLAVAREVMESPTISKELFKEKTTRLAARKASNDVLDDQINARKREEELAEPAEHKQAKDSQARARALRLGLEFRKAIQHANNDLMGALERWSEVGGPLPQEQADEIVEDLTRCINSATAIIEVVEGGKSLDQGLAALLAGGA